MARVKEKKQLKHTFRIKKFYADTLVGTTGQMIKSWTVNDCTWIKLYFGRNLSGQKLCRSFPEDVLEKVEEMNI
jgi:hypothetical protein